MSRSNQIYFDHPGDFGLWEQTCLPIGNGYMGASMFGGIKTERVVLNEKTLWAGGPCENRPDYYGGNHRDRYKDVKQVQELLAAGENKKAEELLPMLTGDGAKEELSKVLSPSEYKAILKEHKYKLGFKFAKGTFLLPRHSLLSR